MKPLIVRLKKSPYPIFVDQGGIKRSFSCIKKHLREDRLFILTNTVLKKLYGRNIAKAAHPLALEWLLIPDGERHKNLKTCTSLYNQLCKKNATRATSILALGGGVVGDIAGFVAATYMRGIDYFHMPTTLLAQVDSSVGGKTGVDLPMGKNLIGAFHQPRAVFIHTRFLTSLPKREICCGLAEVIKYGMIWDKKFVAYLQNHDKEILSLNPKAIATIIRHSCAIKAEIVRRDEKEKGQRAILNFGHTVAHAIETLTGYKKYHHGEAVALGMVFATKLSFELGISPVDHSAKLSRLLRLFHLPTILPTFSRKAYAQAVSFDKKRTLQNINFILLKEIGKVAIVPVNLHEVQRYL